MRTPKLAPRSTALLVILMLVAVFAAVIPSAAALALPEGEESAPREEIPEAVTDSAYKGLPLPISIALCGMAAIALIVCAFCFFPRKARRREERDK